MHAIHFSSLEALATTFVNLAAAFLLGALIGIERQVRQRTAGLRTNTLVAVGAAIFVSLGTRLFEINGGSQTPIHIVAYVVSGIGFLGAGAILKQDGKERVTGLTTAAGIWMTAAIGMAAGMGMQTVALATTMAALAVLSLLPRLMPDRKIDPDTPDDAIDT